MLAYTQSWRSIKLFAVVIVLSSGASLAKAGSSVEEVPPGAVAFVSHVPLDEGRISKAEIGRAIAQISAQRGIGPPPKPDDPRYARIAEEALGELLDAVDIKGEATERNIAVTQADISARFTQVKEDAFKSEAEFRNYLHHARLTWKEARKRVELQILAERVEARMVRGIQGAAARRRALQEFIEDYAQRWRDRTTCAPQYTFERCSNGVA